MRHITKGREPESLTRYRTTAGACYDDYAEKDDVRRALLREQGHICCYCMQRISVDKMRIEHWEPQHGEEGASERDLTYANLLGACPGGERSTEERREQRDRPKAFLYKPAGRSTEEPVHAYHHCDVHKGNTPLTVHPADPVKNCELFIRYLPDGEITAEDAIRRDLHETLNLNLGWLKRNRKKVLDATMEYLKVKHPKGDWPPGLLEREIARRKSVDSRGMLDEYCQVAVYILEKRLRRSK